MDNFNELQNPTKEEFKDALNEQFNDQGIDLGNAASDSEAGPNSAVIGGFITGVIALGTGAYFGVKKLLKTEKVQEKIENGKRHKLAMVKRKEVLKNAHARHRQEIADIKKNFKESPEDFLKEENSAENVVDMKNTKKNGK